MGSCGFDYLLKLPIDKLLRMWYNGNSARLDRGRAAKFSCKMTKERGRPLSLFTVRICETSPRIGRLPPSGFSPDRCE